MAAAVLSADHMAEALAQMLDAPPPPLASSTAAADPLAEARYASRPLALQVVRLACQASAGVATAAHALGASSSSSTIRNVFCSLHESGACWILSPGSATRCYCV